jgi:bacillithiol biosynthesis cysteine-adding enzyme BshC
MERIAIPYRATGRFSPLVLDYLDGALALREFHRWSADPDGLHAAMHARTLDPATRAILCDALARQYAGMDIHPEVHASLHRLRAADTLTVTTGHQLCLFTGPLYVPFKIVDIIRLARELSTEKRAVVPIFWMATEDHDRAEIDHAWINGQKVEWPGAAVGAVGQLKLDGIDAVLDQVDALLGPGSHADDMRALLRRCYRPGYSLAQATRLLIDALFGRFGLIVLDADDHALKTVFAPLMQEELLNHVAARSVHYADAKLAGHYPRQAHVRDINLFHLRPGHRSRIELHGDLYQVLDGGPSFTLDQLLNELERRPEDFSPNVLLRPIYQETVLPNIAYVGGGGELAYWLQLKWLFQAVQVPMPVLLLRTSAAFIRDKDVERLARLGLGIQDIFRPIEELEGELARRNASFDTRMDAERRQIEHFYAELAARAKAADPTLEKAVLAIAKRANNGLDAMERKFLRAAKREQQEKLEQLLRVHEHLFPGGGLQERRDNFIPFFLREGPAFFDRLLAELDPLDARFSVLPE